MVDVWTALVQLKEANARSGLMGAGDSDTVCGLRLLGAAKSSGTSRVVFHALVLLWNQPLAHHNDALT
jgi:hypothetical protein